MSAAERIRVLAIAAPREPWHVEYLGDKGYPQRISNARATLIAQTWEGGEKHPTSEYIALWHPGVALAVAALLEAEAGDDGWAQAEEWPELLAVARAINGGEQS